jgi:hypothetical protein
VRASLVLAAVAACLLLAACEGDDNPANPTPASLSTTLQVFGAQGITLSNVVSGDAGCSNTDLAHAAVSFDAKGLDQTTPTRLYLYGFRNRTVFQQNLSAVDACARSYVTDPQTYESVETSPFVIAGQGPWGPQLKDNLRAALVEAAGTGD